MLAGLVGAEAADEREPSGLVARIERVDQAQQLVRRGGGSDLGADRVLDAAQELDLRLVGGACAIADPKEMPRGGVPIARGGIDAGERLLVAEQQRLVTREDAGGAKLGHPLRRQPASAHEAQALGDVAGKLLVAVAGGAVFDEAEIPPMHVIEIGVAALREGAQQIERGGRLPVGHQHALRVRRARGLVELDGVDDVAAIARQLLAALRLGRRGARLGKLPGDAAELHHRRAAGISEHDRHLQEHAEEIADRVGAMLGKALGAIAALEQERLAGGDAGELLLQLARLTGKHERREGRELALDLGELLGVRVDRDLLDRPRAPALRAPARSHGIISSTKADAI